jgi:hypothetical protein
VQVVPLLGQLRDDRRVLLCRQVGVLHDGTVAGADAPLTSSPVGLVQR